MEVLFWLVPSAVVTLLAMAWATWAGRPQREQTVRSEASYDRMREALSKEHPRAVRLRPTTVRDRSTGIAVRPSRRATTQGERPARRSA